MVFYGSIHAVAFVLDRIGLIPAEEEAVCE